MPNARADNSVGLSAFGPVNVHGKHLREDGDFYLQNVILYACFGPDIFLRYPSQLYHFISRDYRRKAKNVVNLKNSTSIIFNA